MKKIVLHLITILFLIVSEAAMSCCYKDTFYFVSNIKQGASLNVRKEPHPLAPIIGTLNYKQRYFVLKKYTDKHEEMFQHALCVVVDYSPFEGQKSVSHWCHLLEPEGWVNMHYLSACEIETGDEGNIIKTTCSDVIEGKKITDFLFKSRTKKNILGNGSKKLIGPWWLKDRDWGFTLYDDGTASSINSASLIYQKWRIKSNTLCLTIRSIGNHTESVSEECGIYSITGEKAKAELSIGKGALKEVYLRK